MSSERRIVRFALVGLMGAVVQLLAVFMLTRCLGILSVVATPCAVELALLHNFGWHERFTWRDRGSKGIRQRAARLGRFHVGNGLVSLGGNTVLMYCLVERLGAPLVPSAIGAIAACSLLNFLVADRWVYHL